MVIPESGWSSLFFTFEKTGRKTVPSNERGVCLESASRHKVVLFRLLKNAFIFKGLNSPKWNLPALLWYAGMHLLWFQAKLSKKETQGIIVLKFSLKAC